MSLHLSCQFGHLDEVETFLANGSDINSLDDFGYTPLMWALSARSVDIVKILFANGADPFIPSRGGDTVFHFMHPMYWNGDDDKRRIIEKLLLSAMKDAIIDVKEPACD